MARLSDIRLFGLLSENALLIACWTLTRRQQPYFHALLVELVATSELKKKVSRLYKPLANIARVSAYISIVLLITI